MWIKKHQKYLNLYFLKIIKLNVILQLYNMKRNEIILQRHMLAMKGTIGKNMPPEFNEFILRAMEEYAKEFAVEVLDASQLPIPKFLGIIVGQQTILRWTIFLLNIRNNNLIRQIKIYQKISNVDRRKYYIIRSSFIQHKALSTADVDLNRRMRIFGKHVDAKELAKTADCVILPKYH